MKTATHQVYLKGHTFPVLVAPMGTVDEYSLGIIGPDFDAEPHWIALPNGDQVYTHAAYNHNGNTLHMDYKLPSGTDSACFISLSGPSGEPLQWNEVEQKYSA